MSNDRDPALQALFAEAGEDLSAEEFTSQAMAEVDRLRRLAVIGWSCIGLVLMILSWLLAAALQDAVILLTQTLNVSLVDMDNTLVAEILSPLNSVAGVVAIGFIAMHRLFRRIFN